MTLRNMWVEESDFLAIFEEVHRRKSKVGGRVSGAEVLHEWLEERGFYMALMERFQVNEGPGATERTEE